MLHTIKYLLPSLHHSLVDDRVSELDPCDFDGELLGVVVSNEHLLVVLGSGGLRGEIQKQELVPHSLGDIVLLEGEDDGD